MEDNARQPGVLEIGHEGLSNTLATLLARIRALRELVATDESDENGASQAAPDLPTLRQGLSELELLAGALLSTVQEASGELLLAELPGLPLAEALSQLVEARAETQGLSSRVAFTGRERPLPDHLARLLYRIAQEALARVSTHEGARRLRFSLEYRRGEIVMGIEDDGVPGRAEQLFERAPGEALTVPPFLETEEAANNDAPTNAIMRRLRGMAESLGGALTINSSVEQGTQVQVSLPYNAGARQHRGQSEQEAEPPTLDTAEKVRVLIVDGHAVSRAGLRRLLESYPDLEVVGEAAEGTQAVSETAELLPQVVLIDAQLPGEQSLEALRQVRQLNAEIHVLLLADREREEQLYEALRAGASGYILKDIAPDDLARSVRQVARGEVLVQPQMAARLLTRLGGNERVPQENLTARERDVLQLLARGLRNKEIAARLIVSERTVNFHLANIYAKLHVSGRTEALSKALERGLLKV